MTTTVISGNELAAAWDTKFRESPASDFYTGLGGQMFYVRAPAGTLPPYAIFFIPVRKPENVSGAKVQRAMLQVNIYTNDANAYAASDLLEKCEDEFDRAVLSPTGHEKTRLNVESIYDPLLDSEEDGAFWRASIEFWCLLQKTKTT